MNPITYWFLGQNLTSIDYLDMKNVPLISIAFFLLIVSSANGQVRFEKTYGGLDSDFGSSVKQTLDGGYILFGATESYGAAVRDWYLIKTDEFGEELWSKTYGGAAFDHGWDIAQTADTGYILVGNKSHHSFLIKTNSVGDTMWTRAYEGSIFSVQQTLDGGYLLGGSISFVVGNYDMLLIKIKADGEHEWTKNYGSMRGDDCRDVAQTTDGGFVLVGHAWGGMSMVKTDSFGDVLWTRSYGGFEGFSVKQTSDGGFILLGDSTVNGIGSFHVVKTDSIGRTIWAKLFYKGNMYYSGYEVAQTPEIARMVEIILACNKKTIQAD